MTVFSITYDGRTYEIPDRDNQRSRVYDAEFKWGYGQERFASLKECQAYADRVVASATWKKICKRFGYRFPRNKVRVEQGRAGSHAVAYSSLRLISVPVAQMDKATMLHELAHIACPSGVQHQWPFCRSLLELVSRFLGTEAKRELASAMRETGARYRLPPPPLSEERKAALAEQGRKALRRLRE